MSVDSPRSSVFTFQSAVHSDHVLRCLDEQRRRDTLCDVTVVVESRSFRAHRSVLASCSDYFSARFSNHADQGAVISLPDEVTVEGFEPLLQFAYTTKLLFTKENILEIRNSAAVLGFKNLDNSCFEFLIPKFFDSTKYATAVPRKRCCRMKKCPRPAKDSFASQNTDSDVDTDKSTSQATLDEEEEHQTRAASKLLEQPQQNGDDANLDTDSQTDYSLLCKYRKFQMAYRMESCGTETASMSPAATTTTTTEDRCPWSGLPCPSVEDTKDSEVPTSSKYVPMTEGCDTLVSGSPRTKRPHSQLSEARCCDETSGLSCGGSVGSTKVKMEDLAEELSEASSQERPGVAGTAGTGDLGKTVLTEARASGPSGSDHLQDPESEQAAAERSSIEQEVAEHLAKGFWPEASPSRPSAPLQWLKQLDLDISRQDCPFLRDLGAVGAHVPNGEESSRAQGSPYVSSQNSGEESDSLDTEGDSEFYGSERACELPFSVERIASLSRNDFQQMLKLQFLSREQLDFVHDVRRRSKNRIAARRCRKRKLDCIHNLECEIEKLRTEKDKLTTERDRLNHQRLLTWQSFSGLYEKVCSEAALRPEQLQVLAKYSPSSCPLFALLSPLQSTSAQSQAPTEPQDSASSSSVGLSRADSCSEPSTSFAMAAVSDEAQTGPQVLAPLSASVSSGPSGKGFTTSSSSSSSSSEGFGLGAFTSMRPEPVSKLISEK